jgi:hypothetical protein
LLPDRGLGGQLHAAFDAPIEALAGQDADLDLDHVQPTDVLGDVMELESAQDSVGFIMEMAYYKLKLNSCMNLQQFRETYPEIQEMRYSGSAGLERRF